MNGHGSDGTPVEMHRHRRSNCLRMIVLCTSLLCGVAAQGVAYEMDDYTGPVFPADHALNTRIDSLPVHPNSDNFIMSIGASTSLYPDFGGTWDDDGTIRPMGIPYNVVGADQPDVPIAWTLYGDESDPGPWPIPPDPYIETVLDWRDQNEGDRHMLIVDSSTKMLYETGNVVGNANGTEWEGGCGAVFDLTSNQLRPDTLTSADAAGLPIFPLLIRYDETQRALEQEGEVPHAVRFTVQRSQRAYLWPARHYASSLTDPDLPPMGLRFRLKREYDISEFSPRMQVLLRTFKKYGLIVADNGSDWFFQGTHDDRWDTDELRTLRRLSGSDFEAVDISEWLERPGFDTGSAAVPPPSGTVASRITCRPVPDGVELLTVPASGSSDQSLVCTYSVPGPAMVRLTVTDCTGRERVLQSERSVTRGTHRVVLPAAGLSHGVWCIRVTTDTFGSATRSLAVVR